ncbi:MAG TPA: hemolysin family protein [Candidatus Dormibacteraeota bacterium]|nr:hemolysin family protein [Candidatus Dormibacteraeota bacterium]
MAQPGAGEPRQDGAAVPTRIPVNGWLIAVLVVALVLAGLSATAETSLTSVSRIWLRARRAEGDPRAAQVERLHRNPGGYLGTILVTNTLALMLASSSATLLAEQHLGAGAAIWSAVALAILVLLFCEIGPKTYALQHSEAMARRVAGPVALATRLLGPVVFVLAAMSAVFFRVLPGEGGRRNPFLTEEELKELVLASQQEGVVEEEEREMIHGVLEMTDKPVREVMVPRVQMVALPADSSVAGAIAEIREHGHSRIPVYEETVDNITGVIYAKDLLGSSERSRPDAPPLGTLARPPTFVPEAKRLGELLQEMQRAKIHLAVVVDEYGGTAGLVTIEDLLEEIVGPIRDEYDVAEQEEVQLTGPQEALVSASVSLDDVNELLHLRLEGEDFDSVGGLVYAHLGRIPSVGDTVDAGNGITITVEAIDRRAIRTVRLTSVRPFPVDPEESGTAERAAGAPTEALPPTSS